MAKVGMNAEDMGYSLVEQAVGDLISGIKKEDSFEVLMQAEPFYGRLIAAFKKIEVSEKDKGKNKWFVPTAAVAVDGQQVALIVNTDFLRQLSRVQRAAVIKHEAQHIAHRHLFRFKESGYENQPRFNIAADSVINQFNPQIQTLKGMKLEGWEQPFDPCDWKNIPDAKADSTWQTYYERLAKEDEKNGEGEGEGQSGGGMGNGPTNTPYGDVIDDHSFMNQAQNSEADSANQELVEENVKNLIRSVARQTEAGNRPGEIQQILDELNRQSEIPWRTLLRSWMKQSVRQIRALSMMRESISVEGVFPGHKRVPVPEFHVYADMSGSVADDQAVAFFGEVICIQTALKATIHLHQFDTIVHKSEVIDKKVPNIERNGYGGTNFQCCADHARENKIKNIIIMTDGYAPEIDTVGLNVLWAMTENHQDHAGKQVIIKGT
jgi:predicted metal-dependent peptidase